MMQWYLQFFLALCVNSQRVIFQVEIGILRYNVEGVLNCSRFVLHLVHQIN